MNRQADNAHIESEDVAAVRVRKMGESPIRERKTNIDDLTVLVPGPENKL